MKQFLITTILSLSFACTQARDFSENANNSSLSASFQKTNISFIENKGQVTDQDNKLRPDIQFKISAAPGLSIFIGRGAIHYQFRKTVMQQSSAPDPMDPYSRNIPAATYSMYRMDVELIGADTHAQVITEEKQDYYENYFTEHTGGKTAIAYTYNRITYKNIYPNIDWVLYITHGQLKHEFVVRPGGIVADIKLKYGGSTDLALKADGSLAAATPLGTITEQAPVSYQLDGRKVSSSFKLVNDVLTYETGNYSGTLIIDPVLAWGTYFGGMDDDIAYGNATDASGNVYIAGSASSTSSIATSGSYQVTYAGDITDAFLAKFNSSGTLQWATYYGGSARDECWDVATDLSGSIFISGWTKSTSGISTAGTHQPVYGGGFTYGDLFLAKFNGSGAVQWATYYGGPNDENGAGVATDGSGNVYLTGQTRSVSGIATTGAHRTSMYAPPDMCLAKFNSAGVRQWGTYFGEAVGSVGAGYEQGLRIAVSTAGNVHVLGATSSSTGVATLGAYQTSKGGGSWDNFLATFNSAGVLQWATYYGGESEDGGSDVAVNAAGDVYIVGQTTSTTLIATPGAYQTALCPPFTAPATQDMYIAKFNSAGVIQWATYYGGPGNDGSGGVAINSTGDICISGTVSSAGLATPDGHKTTAGLSSDQTIFLLILTDAGARKYATYYGKTGVSATQSIALDAAGNMYLSGCTSALDSIATPGAYQTTFGGLSSFWGDAFLVKFNNCSMPVTGTITGNTSVCTGGAITLSNSAGGGTWTSGNSSIATITTGGIVTGVAVGAVTVSYTVTNACGSATTTSNITVTTLPNAGAVTGNNTVCVANTITLSNSVSGGTWSSSNGNASVSASGIVTGVAAGTSTISYTVTNSCGTASATKAITITTSVTPGTIIGSNTVCETNTITLSNSVSGGTWSSSNGNASVSASGVVTGVTAGTSTISYTVTNSCGTASATKAITVTPAASCPTSINTLTQVNEYEIYPNPTYDAVTISAKEPIRSVVVSSMVGQTVFSGSYHAHDVTVSLAHLPAGVYIVKINDSLVYKVIRK